jgi:peptidyl-prolyl cis-trans isomerase C
MVQHKLRVEAIMRRKIMLKITLCVLLVGMSGCTTQAPPPAAGQATEEQTAPQQPATQQAVTAPAAPTVDQKDIVVSLDQLHLTSQHLGWINPRRPGVVPPPAMVKRWADQWVETHLLYEEALKRGLSEDPQAKFLADLAVKEAYARRLRQVVIEATNVTDQQVAAYYEQNKDVDRQLKEPSRFGFCHVRTKTLEQAQQVIERIKGGESIDTLAKELSIAPDASGGGQINKMADYYVQNQYGDEFVAAMQSASVGDVIGPVRASQGTYEIVRLDAKLPERVKKLDESQEFIKAKLTQEARIEALRNLMDSLREKAASRIVKTQKLLEIEESLSKPPQPRPDTSPPNP